MSVSNRRYTWKKSPPRKVKKKGPGSIHSATTMPLFHFCKKKPRASSPLALRKTKSTGNISDGASSLDTDSSAGSTTHHQKLNAIAPDSSAKEPQQPVEPGIFENKPSNGNTTTELLSVTNASQQQVAPEQQQRQRQQRTQQQQQEQEDNNNSASPASTPPRVKHGLTKSTSSPCTPKEESVAADRLHVFSPSDLEKLLSLETQERSDAQEERARMETAPPRPSRLKFELPVTPTRSRSPVPPAYSNRPRQRWSLPDESLLDESPKKAKSRRSRWSRLMGSDDASSSSSSAAHKDTGKRRPFAIGDQVCILHRPLPMLGKVRYIGPVHFAPGDEWVGVELESRGM